MTRKELKLSAKEKLQGHKAEAFFVLFLCWIIPSIISAICSQIVGLDTEAVIDQLIRTGSLPNSIFIVGLINFIVLQVISINEIRYFLKRSRNEETSFKILADFSVANLILPVICISIVTGIFVWLWSLLLVIPGIIATFAYTFATIIKIDDEETGVMESIKTSKMIMKGHKWELFVLELSFIPNYLLMVITLGIYGIWFLPYREVVMCNFYNDIAGK